MLYRFVGLIVAFTLIVGVVAVRPGSIRPAAALLATETATNTAVPSSTSTPTTPTVTVTATATALTATPTMTATPGPASAAVLNFPTSACNGAFPFPTSADVTFSWTGPANVSAIYLDLSLFDNNFQDGTFITAVLPAGTTQFTWQGLLPGFAHFWRVTGQGNDGSWVMSNFGSFTPCGTQRLLGMSYVCTGNGRATVVFRWAPGSTAGILQYLDLTLFNNGFAPGTFLGAGPLPPTQQAVVWPGILANIVHYYRVNELGAVFGWGPSATGTFVASCPL